MAEEIDLSPTEFLIQKMEELDGITQVLICMRHEDGEISYDTTGQIASDTLGMLAFMEVAAKEHLRRELYADEDDD
jgi:hypothetical protein